MNRDEVYFYRSKSRLSKRFYGDFCHFIKFSMGSTWEVTELIGNSNNYWGSLSISELMIGKTKETKRNIIRWRTEGK